jgi:hypothetical protein
MQEYMGAVQQDKLWVTSVIFTRHERENKC